MKTEMKQPFFSGIEVETELPFSTDMEFLFQVVVVGPVQHGQFGVSLND
jgi:hypothetical protein